MPSSDYYLILGHCYRGLERFAEALEVYKKAVEIAPSSIYAHLGLAVTCINMGREHDAREAASKVLITISVILRFYRRISIYLDFCNAKNMSGT
jgi:tetratricopeptide (TPR) repeat protein